MLTRDFQSWICMVPRRFNPTIGSGRNPTEPIGGFDRPLKLAPGINLLKLLISSRRRSKPTDRFLRIPTLGSHRIPTLGIRISVHNPESDRILLAGWILPDPIGFVVGLFGLGCPIIDLQRHPFKYDIYFLC
jgi:hypothetical protein